MSDNNTPENENQVIDEEKINSQFSKNTNTKLNALEIFFPKGFKTDTVFNQLIKDFQCHPHSITGNFVCPIIQQERLETFFAERSITVNLKQIWEGYFVLPDNRQRAERVASWADSLSKKIITERARLQEDRKAYYEHIDKRQSNENADIVTSQSKIFEERKKNIDAMEEQRNQLLISVELLEQLPAELILSQKSPLNSAERLTEINFKQNDIQTIHYCGDAFWEWEGPCYNELKANGVRKIIYDFLKNAKVETKKDKEIVLVDFDPNQSKVNNVLDAFKAMCDCHVIPESGMAWIRNDNFPSVDNLIVFKNGILNIEAWLKDKTVQLLQHTPLLMNPSYLPFDFDPLYQEPIEWLKFLNSIWPEDPQSIETLQEWFGYSLTQNTRFHKILLIVGPPRSGKGTIGRILRALLGDQNVVGPTLSSLAGPFGLQPWINKTHAIISDARLSGKSDHGIITERLLSVSGEDPLTIDRKYRDPITTTLPTRITIMSNELPHLGDSSGAIANRYIILPMTNSWLGKEDMDLEIRIRKELPQILLWALEGLKRLKERNRFNQPESARQHFEEIMAMSSPIKAFIFDRCELGPTKWIEIKVLFQAWIKWCEDTGHDRPGNLQVFGRNLRAAFPGILPKQKRPGIDSALRDKAEGSRDKNDRMRVYNGIGLSILPN